MARESEVDKLNIRNVHPQASCAKLDVCGTKAMI